MNRILAFGLLGLLALAAVPAPASANHAACGGTGIWLGPATSDNCVGFYVYLLDPSFVCIRGVGHVHVNPVTAHGGAGAGCPVGAIVHLP